MCVGVSTIHVFASSSSVMDSDHHSMTIGWSTYIFACTNQLIILFWAV
jgi:hypothetical protein